LQAIRTWDNHVQPPNGGIARGPSPMDSNGSAPAVVDKHNIITVALHTHLGGAIRRHEDVVVDLPPGANTRSPSSITAGVGNETDRVPILVEFGRTAFIERVSYNNVKVNRTKSVISTIVVLAVDMVGSDRLRHVAIGESNRQDGLMGRLIVTESVAEVIGR